MVATSGGGGKGRRAERQMRASGGGAASGAQGEEKGEEVLARGRQGEVERGRSMQEEEGPGGSGGAGLSLAMRACVRWGSSAALREDEEGGSRERCLADRAES